MNLKVFKCYISMCREIKVTPSFEGLRYFKKFYEWEMKRNV